MFSSRHSFLAALLVGVVLLSAGCVGSANPQTPASNHSAPHASANTSVNRTVQNPAGLGQFCGGIAGIACSSGLNCKRDGDYADAGGQCVSASGAANASNGSSQIANPASEFCAQKGGRSVIINEPDGQVGFCILPNGTSVEEWNYYRSGGHPAEPIACTMEYAPVCGSDHQTYSNSCMAHAAGMSIVYRGECTNATSSVGSNPSAPNRPVGSSTLTNPASVHCIDLGGTLEIQTAASGDQTGYCTLPSGKVCDEWALFREECSG